MRHEQTVPGEPLLDETNRIRGRVIASAGSLVASNAVGAILSLVTIHLVAHTLGPPAYGELTIIYSLGIMLSLLADLGVSSVTTREIALQPERAGALVGEALGLRLVLCAAVLPILVGLGWIAYPRAHGVIALGALIMGVDLYFNAILAILQAYYTAQTRSVVPALLLVLSRVIYLLGALSANLLRLPVLWIVISYAAGEGLAALIGLWLTSKRVRISLSIDLRAWWAVLILSLPVGGMQVLARVYSRLDAILLSLLKEPSVVAQYGIAYNFADVLTNLPSLLMVAVLPALVADGPAPKFLARFQGAFDVVVWLGAPIAMGGFVLRASIVSLVAGKGFAQAGGPLAVLILTVAISFPQVAFAWGCLTIGEYKGPFRVMLGVTGLNVVVNLLLIPPFGAMGAAWSQLISESISLIAIAMLFSWRARVRVNYGMALRSVLVAGLVLASAQVANRGWGFGNPLLRCSFGTAILGTEYVLLSIFGGSLPGEVLALTTNIRGGARIAKLDLVAYLVKGLHHLR